MSDEITFYEVVSHDSDYNPLTTIGKFQNLGNFSKTLSKFRRENVETIYLIILNDTFFTLRVNTFEEIMIFLKKQGWYDEKPDNFIIKQLYLEFTDEDDNWEDKGVHPLDQQDKVEQILKNHTIWEDSEGGNEKIEFDRKELEEGMAYIVSEAYGLGRYDEETTDFEQAIKKWIDTRGAFELPAYFLDDDNN
ncbi:hypothetical protein [Lactococcus lactis]|uniref:hypothetical protein n=1 Tax=Lactococcus lactis TaxID=1358 RepID=UPI0022DF0F3C|nr:hypothetical protein [Lactococcus lactis]